VIGVVDARHMTTNQTFMNRIARLVAALAGLAVALVALAPSAGAAQDPAITCGTTVTTDIRLSADLLDCEGPGLVIGASGVSIDLAGHVIDGTGTDAGIENGGGYDDVRVVGGTLREFLFGVHLFETSGAELDRVVVHANAIGVLIGRSGGVELDRVTASGNLSSGVEVGFSDRIDVRRSTAFDNGLYGIADRATTDASYVGNTLSGNGASGLDLWFSDGAVVDRNHVAANDSDGISLTGIESAVVDRNSSIANAGNGISIDRPGNTLRRNEAIDNHGIGIAAPDGTIDGGRNRARGNLGGDCTGVVCR
jgi:hypothetical protein